MFCECLKVAGSRSGGTNSECRFLAYSVKSVPTTHFQQNRPKAVAQVAPTSVSFGEIPTLPWVDLNNLITNPFLYLWWLARVDFANTRKYFFRDFQRAVLILLAVGF